MSSRKLISAEVQEIWSKLNASWQGEAASAFHDEYILHICDLSDSFEDACADLVDIAETFSKELQILEQTLDN